MFIQTQLFLDTLTLMSTLRRLINLCLMLAFASYGMVVAAPAHAHGHDSGQVAALHALTADIDTAGHDHYHDHDAGGDQSTGDDQGGTHNDYHVHAVAAFTTVDEPTAVAQPVMISLTSWADLPSLSVSGLFSPLKKPPRILL